MYFATIQKPKQTDMKKVFMMVMLALPVLAFSQQAVVDRFKQKVKNRVDQRIDEGMDKSIDKAEEEITKKPNQEKPKEDGDEKTKPVATGNGGKEQAPAAFQSYSRYDFIPGENILYAEDFLQDAIGEMPLKWITNNRGETVSEKSANSKWMRLFPGSRFASPPVKPLPQNFTVEMDIMLQFSGEGGYGYPNFELKLMELLAGDGSARSYVVNEEAQNEVSLVLMPTGAGEPLNVQLKSYKEGSEYFSNGQKVLKTFSDNAGKPIHISIWVQKERVRYWINGDKVYDIPQAVPAGASFNRIGFSVETSIYEDDQLGMYVSNIKVAEGTPDMRSKLLTEGKLVTHGILFDVASDKIKAESAGVLKEIAAILKENPELKIKVLGHTDSDGDAARNLELSKKRSIAVKAALAQAYGIDAARIETEGMGETKPIADNAFKEGKAQNRRVEFIKL
jgi:OmpA-OmpF porin, OOP family